MRLGISAEALRLRLERGEAWGFKRDDTSFVYVNDYAAERRFGEAPEGSIPGPSSGPSPGARLDQSGAASADSALPVVVEFQKLELTRLLRENERLNTRLDRLFDEIRHLRDMQQREQVLRQQEQTLRQQNQETLDRLTDRPALPPAGVAGDRPAVVPPSPPSPPEFAERRSELVLTRTVAANGRIWRNSKSARPSGPTAGNLAPTPDHTPASSAFVAGTIAPEEAAELAVILDDIGQSLRDSEAFRRYPPIKPGSAPQRDGDRRPANGVPGRPVPSHAAAPSRANGAAPRPLPAQDTALLAILDSMGPTAEDRRNAARDLRRLLRGRIPPPAGEA